MAKSSSKKSSKAAKAATGAVLSTNRSGNFIGMTGNTAARDENMRKIKRAQVIATRGGTIAEVLKVVLNNPKACVVVVFASILTAVQKSRYGGVVCSAVAKRSDKNGEFTIIDAAAMADIFQNKKRGKTSPVSVLRTQLLNIGASVENRDGADAMRNGTTRWNLPGFELNVDPGNYPSLNTNKHKDAIKKGGLWEKRGLAKAKYYHPAY